MKAIKLILIIILIAVSWFSGYKFRKDIEEVSVTVILDEKSPGGLRLATPEELIIINKREEDNQIHSLGYITVIGTVSNINTSDLK